MIVPNIAQGLSLEAFLLIMIGYLWIQSYRKRQTDTLKAFFRLCSSLMCFLIIDVPVRLSDLNLVKLDNNLIYVLNALYIALETLTIYEWFIYVLTIHSPQDTTFKKRMWSTLPMDVMVVLLIISSWTGWLFYVDEAGTYTRGSLFALQFLLPYSYLVSSFVITFTSYRHNSNKRIFLIIMTGFMTSIIASVLQVVFSGSFTHAGLCLVVLLVYLEMFQTELKQMDQMKSLKPINEKLEETNNRLNETIMELEQSIANERAASNAKNEFLSRMSHDIRTPLNGILGIIEIDDHHPEETKLLAENRKKAKIAASHLGSLINDVLDMSKLSSGTYELANEPFVVSDIMKDVLVIANLRAESMGITIINENEKDDYQYPITLGSALHIKRILINIIGNAIKYNKENGSIRVRLDHEAVENTCLNNDSLGNPSGAARKMHYRFTISDTGIGMSPEFIRKLFEPFAQERIDARSSYEGTGLGMAITKGLVDKMGGTIQVESTIGTGSVFVVDLTFNMDQGQKKTETEVEGGNVEGLHVLLAEDNELNAEIAQTLLEESGMTVDVAVNGQIALEKFSSNSQGYYDAILMDCMMPVMNGYDAAKSIRQLDRPDASMIPIIAMTANAFADDVNHCLEAGMNAHISKPFEIDRVKTVLGHYCHQK